MSKSYIATSLAILLLATTALAANAASTQQNPPAVQAVAGSSGLTVKVATISAGRLVILGAALTPGTVVKIDGTTLSAVADAQKVFRFDVNYRTPDCRLTLGSATGKLSVLIGDCGPMGVVPRGAWVSNRTYVLNDLVYDAGSTYRALRSNANRRPVTSLADWQIFAARGVAGAVGPKGQAGAQGVAGPAGPAGAKGDKGDAGADGAVGAAGPVGPQGPQGDPGADGAVGPAGPAGADGAVGPPGPAGADGAQGPVGPIGPQGPQGPVGLTGATGAQVRLVRPVHRVRRAIPAPMARKVPLAQQAPTERRVRLAHKVPPARRVRPAQQVRQVRVVRRWSRTALERQRETPRPSARRSPIR